MIDGSRHHPSFLATKLHIYLVNNIPGIEEVNMIKDDGSVIHFNNPKVSVSAFLIWVGGGVRLGKTLVFQTCFRLVIKIP